MTPAPHEDVTLGEIARGLVSLEGRMNEKFASMNRRLDSLEYVPRGEHNLLFKVVSDRLRDLEDAKTWMSRALVASVLFPVLVAAVVAMVVTR